MRTAEFRQKFKSQIDIFEAWGNFVVEKITDKIKSGDSKSSTFLKMEPSIRIKDMDSLIAKAFYRNKKYKNPYEDITDKVGVRFIVLLEENVKILCSIIENIDTWSCSKDKDYEIERANEPLLFNYQSMHYVVKTKYNIKFNNITIPINTPCEIQIRTILQHAYSELTHDRIYKSSIDPTSEVKRVVAKSMAFLETTDEYFQKVDKIMFELPIFKLYDILKSKFFTIDSNFQNGSKVNLHILYAYCDFINSNKLNNSKIFDEFDKIVQSSQNKTYLNNQPIIYFIYYMCTYNKNTFMKNWVYTEDEALPYFTQLGISL